MAAVGKAWCLLRGSSWSNKLQKSNGTWSKCIRTLCDAAPSSGSSDNNAPPQFTDAAVKDILTRITGMDLQKVFRPVKQELKAPTYKLLTDEQLEQAVALAKEQAEKLLQMPPVLPERTPIDDILSEDKVLEGLNSAKYVFTDINNNLPHKERFIVVREPTGTLRKATWEERDRLIQAYFPRAMRKISPPLIFQEQNLKMQFSRNQYEHVLDLCLVQFEPDSSEYIKVHTATYEDVEKNEKYDLLRSTRHFGGLAWYLVKARRIDGLIVDMLKRQLFQDAVSLVHLFHMVHPNSESALEAANKEATNIDLLTIYAQKESQRSGYIELALQTYKQPAAEALAA